MTRTSEIRLIVGTPVPKYTPQQFGGPTVAFQLRDNEQVELTVEALSAEGNPASVTTTWASSDPTVASVEDKGNGTALVVASPEATGGIGSTTITATVTDTSDGDTHEGTFDIEVVAGDAVTVNIVPGEVEEKPQSPDVPTEGEPAPEARRR